MLLKNTKVCTKCKKEKLVSEFHKKSDTNDGLQFWCKQCQSEANKESQKKKRLQKRNTQLKRFSQYHLNKGLQYKIKGPRTKNSNRQEVVYKCLDCGEEVNSTLDLAWAYKFKCKECFKKGTSTPLFEHKNSNVIKQDKLYNKLNNHKCSCGSHTCKKESNIEDSNDYIKELKESSNKYPIQWETVKVIYIPVKECSDPIEEVPHKKENRFIKWFKKLFNK